MTIECSQSVHAIVYSSWSPWSSASLRISAGQMEHCTSPVSYTHLNGLGVAIEETVSAEELFTNGLGDLVAEVPADRLADMDVAYTLLGTVTAEPVFTYGNMTLSEKEALDAWKKPLEKVFPTKAVKDTCLLYTSRCV